MKSGEQDVKDVVGCRWLGEWADGGVRGGVNHLKVSLQLGQREQLLELVLHDVVHHVVRLVGEEAVQQSNVDARHRAQQTACHVLHAHLSKRRGTGRERKNA